MNTDLKEIRRKRNEGFRMILLIILPVMFLVIFFITYSSGYYKEKEYVVTVKGKEMTCKYTTGRWRKASFRCFK